MIGKDVAAIDSVASHAAVMNDLSARLDGLLGAVPPGSRVVYLDVPLHFNVGDLLINAGTESFFTRSGIMPVCRLTFFDACHVDWSAPDRACLKAAFVRMMERIDPAYPILFHGGGSLGDLYPELQAMREAVVAAFPDRRIVLFPQSLHFDSLERQRASLGRMLGHRDLHLFLRDRHSLDAVRAASPGQGALMPDMAHALWPELEPYRARAASAGTLIMRRRDDETSGIRTSDSFDWDDIIGPMDTLVWRAIRKAMHVNLDASRRLPVRAWYGLRDRIIRRAATRFASAAAIETDRLHGLLLSCLLARPVRYHDNRYGKLSRYVGEWLQGSPMIEAADRQRSAA